MNVKDKVIIAAKEIFRDYSYEHATIKMICDRAHVNIASINYYFHTKKELYLEVINSMHERGKHKIFRMFEVEIKGNSQDDFKRFLAETIEVLMQGVDSPEEEKLHKIFFKELNTPTEAFDDIYQIYFLPMITHIELGFKNFFPSLSDKECSMWVISLFSQIGAIYSLESIITKHYGNNFYKAENVEKFSNHIVDSICGAIYLKQ